MRKYALLLMLACSCQVEAIDATGGVDMAVHEQQFLEIDVGDAAADVETALSHGTKKISTSPEAEIWEYTVWRGEPPSLLKTLITREPPKMEHCVGRLSLQNGRVISREVVDCRDCFEIPPSSATR